MAAACVAPAASAVTRHQVTGLRASTGRRATTPLTRVIHQKKTNQKLSLATSATATATDAVATVGVGGNPLAGVSLLTVDGEAKAIPFWAEDQTVVVTFLRHFG